MAKYTMLLAEYLKRGGQLPASFDLIDGFEDLFVAKYCDLEIGFENDSLFYIKLEYTANLVMQAYADRITARAYYWTKANNPAKTYYESATTTTNIGAQENKTTELPIDSDDAESNGVNNFGAREDVSVFEKNRTDNDESIDDILKMLDYLNRDVTTIVERCLEEFKPLFMGVY